MVKQSYPKQKKSAIGFLVLFGVVFGLALFWGDIERALEPEPKDGTIFIFYSDGEVAAGAKLRLMDASGNELGTATANRKGRVDLPDMSWNRLLIESDYHGFPQRAVVRQPVHSWPSKVYLEGTSP